MTKTTIRIEDKLYSDFRLALMIQSQKEGKRITSQSLLNDYIREFTSKVLRSETAPRGLSLETQTQLMFK